MFLLGHEQKLGLLVGPSLKLKEQGGFPNDNYAAEKKLCRIFRVARESKENASLLLLGETALETRVSNLASVGDECKDAHVDIAVLYHVEGLAAKVLSVEEQKLFYRVRGDAEKVHISSPMREIVSAVNKQGSSPEATLVVNAWERRYRDVVCHGYPGKPSHTCHEHCMAAI